MEAFQKERLIKLNQKMADDQRTLTQLQQLYLTHKQSLSELQQQNQNLQRTYDDLKAQSMQKDSETENIFNMVKYINQENDKLNLDIIAFNNKITQGKNDCSIISQRINKAIATKECLISDIQVAQAQVSEYEKNQEQYKQIHINLPEIQQTTKMIQQEIISHQSVIEDQQHIILNLLREDHILEGQRKEENKALELLKQKLNSIKVEIDAKTEMDKKFNDAQSTIERNRKAITKLENSVKVEGKKLLSLKKADQQSKHNTHLLKTSLEKVEDEIKPIKQMIIDLNEELKNRKEKVNNKVADVLKEKTKREIEKFKQMQDKNKDLKEEIEEMKQIVSKLEHEILDIETMTKRIDQEQMSLRIEAASVSPFTDKSDKLQGNGIHVSQPSSFNDHSYPQQNIYPQFRSDYSQYPRPSYRSNGY
ncbi:hypothetical protein TRFO_40984 [Tritrichomonas foetus]|uniref:Uncharacterized protein n=1 Tax=Tritrichomonas foetus TaxID=1144522 RepID=A0A1J4J1Q1_9EUKA|nr:hypothetical protein TRFO_40984 [Tritrichomonas foetus]|eukprot:OHS92697.1 hypothetical protein TRFO_40984 [Tritrichomonas foetus]